MKTVQISDLQLYFGERAVLKDVQLTLSSQTKAALTGGNGSGKSSLMKILNGMIQPDRGNIAVQKETRISYLPQSGRTYQGKSLKTEVETAFEPLHRLVAEKQEIEQALSGVKDHDKKVQQMLERQHEIEERLLAVDYYNRDKEIEQVLTGLGFQRDDFTRACEHFSGGWQMRIALAKVLLEHPDILLLDEPTNYLDLEARNWLEAFLVEYSGGFLIVSHDRYFLDTTVKETYELFMGQVKRYPGNYSEYLVRRQEEMEELSRQYERQQEEIQRLENFIQKFRYNASKARQVQSRIKYLEKMERIELPDHMKSIHFSFPPAPHSGKMVLQLNHIEKAYASKKVLQELSLEVRRGEKLVVTGPNGAGKSTLLRIIAGVDEAYKGEVRLGSGVNPGYFNQEQRELEQSSSSIIELFESEAPTDLIPRLRNLLGAFLFQGDDIFKSLNVLSGGELSRIALLRLLMQPHNLLILDEPTNHLDIHSKDVLLDALQSFDGTLVFVSHDRYFIEHLATRVLQLGEGEARDFPGDYSYYLYRLEREQQEQVESSPEKNGGQETENSASPSASQPTRRIGNNGSSSKDQYRQSKQQKNRLRKLDSEETSLMEEMERLEREHTEIQSRMSEPEVYSDGAKVKELQEELQRNESEHGKLSAQWEALLMEKEALMNGEEQ